MKYVATVKRVREVILEGHADSEYWSEHLHPLDLQPRAIDGRAEVAIGAFGARWMGIRFKELIVAVSLCDGSEASRLTGHYLLQGYNQNRFFAYVERRRFKTPYLRGAVNLVADPPACMQLDGGEGHRLDAAMGGVREASETVEEVHEGPIFLPADGGLHYFASLSGIRSVFPFDPSCDSFVVDSPAEGSGLRHIAASGFRARTWRIGQSSTHARSKTFRSWCGETES